MYTDIAMGSQPIYDVIVVDSGVGGGIASHVLARKGLRVLCLEAGCPFDPRKDSLPTNSATSGLIAAVAIRAGTASCLMGWRGRARRGHY